MENNRVATIESHLIAMLIIGIMSTFVLTFTIVYLDILKDSSANDVAVSYELIEFA